MCADLQLKLTWDSALFPSPILQRFLICNLSFPFEITSFRELKKPPDFPYRKPDGFIKTCIIFFLYCLYRSGKDYTLHLYNAVSLQLCKLTVIICPHKFFIILLIEQYGD